MNFRYVNNFYQDTNLIQKIAALLNLSFIFRIKKIGTNATTALVTPTVIRITLATEVSITNTSTSIVMKSIGPILTHLTSSLTRTSLTRSQQSGRSSTRSAAPR